ncbi:MAG: ATP-binding cassette domain-containing protein, partial [Solobacterium sp.]|nr:ATP-binding cassette domain-containing protein [Solobacterium sp.]
MATVSLKHIQKIYPNSQDSKPKKKKKKDDEPVEKKPYQLKITDEGVVAVDDFNLEIADKEFIVLVGPSGCGKSTTLRMVAGLEEITRGELRIDDRLVNDVAPKDRDIAMVFQNYALYPHMTVRQNLEFPLKLRKVPKDEMDRRVNEAAEILGITQYLDRKPKALSGGQRQRVAIGRAIVREPKVLLMDEPLSNLDAKLRNQMRAEIIKLRQRINTTFIYVTHDQTEAMTLGDRIVIMKDGEVQQIGTPQEVFNKPVNTFVAGFIGMPQMNMFDGRLVKKDGKYAVQVGDATIV